MDVPLEFLLDEFAAIAGRQAVDLAVARASNRVAAEQAASFQPPTPNGHEPALVGASGARRDGAGYGDDCPDDCAP